MELFDFSAYGYCRQVLDVFVFQVFRVYKKVCGADLDIVLDNIKRVYLEGKHLEITNLIINDYNDSVEEISELCDFVVTELGQDVPLHFSRAFPYYKMDDISPTRPEILFKAKEIALDKGIENVYLGNI